MATDTKWFENTYDEDTIMEQIPITRTIAQFRADMSRIVSKWNRQIHAGSIINKRREQVDKFLTNLELVIDKLAEANDTDNDDPETADTTEHMRRRITSWLDDIGTVRSRGRFIDEQQEQSPRTQDRPRHQVLLEIEDSQIERPVSERPSTSRDHENQQQQQPTHQQQPAQSTQMPQDSNNSRHAQTFTWQNQSSIFRSLDETILPPGLRENGRSFIDRLPNVNVSSAHSTMIYDEEATPTLEMFEDPRPRVATQGRVKRWANFRGDGQSVQHFTGEALDFARYAKRFYEEVAENPNLSWAARYEELSRTLPPEVRRKALDGTEANRDGYLEGWDYLFQVYNNKTILVETCKTRLTKIKPVASEYDFDDLHELCTTAKRAVRALLATGVDYGFIDSTILHTIMTRCPRKLRSDLTDVYGKTTLTTIQVVDYLSRVVNKMRYDQMYEPSDAEFQSGGGGGGRANASSSSRQRPRPQTTTIAAASTGPSTTISPSADSQDSSTELEQCIFCDHSDHNSLECQDGTLQDRSTKARRLGRCFKCLRRGHMQLECRTRVRCSACNGNHPRSLCRGGRRTTTSNTNVISVEDQLPDNESLSPQVSTTTTNVNLASSPESIFMTTVAKVNDRSVRVLLDTGCGISCVKQSVVTRYGWKTTTINPIQVRHFGSDTSIDVATTAVIIRLEGTDGRFIDAALVVFPELTSSIATIRPTELDEIQRSYKLSLSNCTSPTGCTDIDIILGVYHVGHASTGAEYRLSQRWMVKPTLFGDILFGERPPAYNILAVSVEDMVQKSTNEQDFLDAYMSTIRSTDDGRYVVELPAISLPIQASNNKTVAIRRYHQMISRAKRENRLSEVNDYFQELIHDGVLELVTDDDTHAHVYLPCHYVIKESSTTTKLRAVFDGGAGRFPLNDNLFKGFTAWNLVTTLLRFRRDAVGVVADLAKAFLQIQIAEIDRDYLRIWWNNRSYRFCRMPFGLSSSPFLLSVVLLFHLHQHRHEQPQLSSLLSQSFYVDDLVLSLPADTNFERFRNDSIELLQSGKFDLRKWRCSDVQFDRQWAPDSSPTSSVLGLTWNVLDDTLAVPFDTTSHPIPQELTKRSLASLLSSLYDPLGLFGPLMIRWRLLLRQAWTDNHDWDSNLSDHLQAEVRDVYRDSASISSVSFPRHSPNATQLVIFCDASRLAYGAVAYFGGHLMHSRAHLSRIKSPDNDTCLVETIPKLEWQALILAGDLLETLRPALMPTDILVLSDSKLCLDRLHQHPNTMKPTLALQAIRLHTVFRNVTLGHVGSKMNRADILSRGASLQDLVSRQWWILDRVPTFSPYSLARDSATTLATIPVKPSVVFPSHWSLQKQIDVCYFIGRFLVARYPDKSRLSIAWMIVLRIAQRLHLSQDLQAHFNGTTPPIDRRWNLTTSLHSDGLLHVITRLAPTDTVSDEARFPVLVDEHSARMIIRHLHVKLFHAGVRSTLVKFRDSFYTRRSKQLALSELKRCCVCRETFGKAESPRVGLLPAFRTSRADQFQRIGIDMFSFPSMKNVYGLMVTCLVTRSLHVEIVRSLSATDLLLALRIVFSLYTVPELIVSDNGTNFRRAAKAFTVMKHATQARFDTRWYFNCPAAPFRGGVFERMIGTFKRAFKTVSLHHPTLPIDQLRVVSYEICAVLNARPLYTLADEVITPNHFSSRRSLPFLSADSVRCLKTDQLAHVLAKQRKLINGVWTRWFSLYVLELRQLNRLNSHGHQHKVGDTVLVDCPAPRQSWPLATIQHAHPGSDGVARTFTVKLQDGTISVRPAQRLLSLEGTWSLGREGLVSPTS